MRRVSQETAVAIATAQHPLFLELREIRGKFTDPKLSREEWIRNRSAEIMRLGASDAEIRLLKKEKESEKSSSFRDVLRSFRAALGQ